MDATNLEWLELMPDGWKSAFKDDIIKELDKVIKQEKIENFRITDLKEKWFRLVIYYEPYNEKIEEVVDKYYDLSADICLACGSPKPCKSHPNF